MDTGTRTHSGTDSPGVDVHERAAATAKATLVRGATTFTDYFVLLKVGGQWRIANKVYHGQPTVAA